MEEVFGVRQQATLERVCEALLQQLSGLGVDAQLLPESAEKAVDKDPYDGSSSWGLTWRDAKGSPRATLRIHGDGSFYAEYDVQQFLPTKDARWLDAVVAWGNNKKLTVEPRFIET